MDSRLAILTDYVRQKNAAAASKLEPKQTWSSQAASDCHQLPNLYLCMSSSHVFTNSETTNLQFFYIFSLFCFSTIEKNANKTVHLKNKTLCNPLIQKLWKTFVKWLSSVAQFVSHIFTNSELTNFFHNFWIKGVQSILFLRWTVLLALFFYFEYLEDLVEKQNKEKFVKKIVDS